MLYKPPKRHARPIVAARSCLPFRFVQHQRLRSAFAKDVNKKPSALKKKSLPTAFFSWILLSLHKHNAGIEIKPCELISFIVHMRIALMAEQVIRTFDRSHWFNKHKSFFFWFNFWFRGTATLYAWILCTIYIEENFFSRGKSLARWERAQRTHPG